MTPFLQYLKTEREQTLQLLAWYFKKYGNKKDREKVLKCFRMANLEDYTRLIGSSASMIPESVYDDRMLSVLTELRMCGTLSSNTNEEGLRGVYPKGYRRAK